MKRVRCPKCDTFVVFDETQYDTGQSLVFVCQHCHKEFTIRLGRSQLTDIHAERTLDEQAHSQELGSIVVVENRFAFKQVIPLDMGDNEIGRYVKGTRINKPIETRDPSVDTFHCVLRVEKDKKGRLRYILRDAPSTTGTFYQNSLLRDNDRILLPDGAVITIGATTFILRQGQSHATR